MTRSRTLPPCGVLLCAVPLMAVLELLCAPAWAQSSSRGAMAGYRIAGQAVNAVSGEPLRGATVSALTDEDGRLVESVQTDAQGRFSLPGLAAGKYPLTASKRGFRTSYYDEHDGFSSAIVTGEGQDTTHLVFQLTPGAVLRGVVTADGGDPVEGASVLLFKHQSAISSSPAIMQVDAATTDDTGAYEFTNLPAGEYLLAAKAKPWYARRGPSGRSENADSLDVAYPVTYFDSTTDEAAASPITLTGGSREEAAITLHAVPALHLQVPAPQRPNGTFALPEMRMLIFGIQTADAAGDMSSPRRESQTVVYSGVAPGRYEMLQGDPPRISDLDATASGEIDPNTGAPALSIGGTVRSANGAALPDDLAIVLEPLDAGSGQTRMQASAPRGQFRFEKAAPGSWAISIAGAGRSLPVVAVSAGGASLPGNQIRLRDRSLTVALTVSRGDSRVQGFARKEGKPAAGVMVVLVPRDPGVYRALVRRDQSDSDGSFSLRDVAQGQYTVVAIEDGWKLDWQQPEVIARYLPGGVPVTISNRSGAIVSLAQPVPVSAP